MARPRTGAGAVLLAGGRSSRMGRDKALLRFGGVTLIERTVSELARRFDPIVVVAAPMDTSLPRLDATIVRDPVAHEGPVGALARGLRASAAETSFACSCDLPFVSADLGIRLCQMIESADAVIPMVGGRLQPLYAAYRVSCADRLEAMGERGEARLTRVAEFVKARIISEAELQRLSPSLLAFTNINTEEDYTRALQKIGERQT